MPFTLSHHPECKKYLGHYITVGRYKLCIGCFFGYTSAVAFIILHIFYGLLSFALNVRFLFFAFLIFLFLYASKVFDRHLILKISSKIYISFIMVAIILDVYYLADATRTIRIVMAFLAYSMMNIVLTGIRGYKMVRTCRKCEQWKDFPLCDGFINIVRKLQEDEFVEVIEHGHA